VSPNRARRNPGTLDAQRRPNRTSDHLANERTLLAWIRTSIAIIVFGFVVARFGIALRELGRLAGGSEVSHRPGASEYLGAVLVAVGVVFALAAWLHYAHVRSAIERDDFRPTNPAAAVLTIIVAAVGLALIAYLIVTAASV
jgi:putative membrane protein